MGFVHGHPSMASPQTSFVPLLKANSIHIAPPGPTRASGRRAYTTSPMYFPYSWVPPRAEWAQIPRPRLHRFLRHMTPLILCISSIVEGSSPQISSFYFVYFRFVFVRFILRNVVLCGPGSSAWALVFASLPSFLVFGHAQLLGEHE